MRKNSYLAIVFLLGLLFITETHADSSYLAPPKEVQLEGPVRTVQIVSPLGQIRLRWPRVSEKLFGRTPERAVVESMNTISRTLKNNSFPSQVTSLQTTWEIVFIDENLPESQIPGQLITNCHPAWMTPPANIYVVSQRVAAGCGTKRPTIAESDKTLTLILLHEIGHVLEYYMLNGKQSPDRVRAEGFATWFEQLSADYSNFFSKGSVRREYEEAARQAMRIDPNFYHFDGTFSAYTKASLLFRVIEVRRGVAGIRDLYAVLAKGNQFIPSIFESTHWSEVQLAKELEKLIN